MSRSSDSTTRRGLVVELPLNKPIDKQAAEWLAKLDGDAPTDDDLHAFRQWIGKDPANRQAFEDMVGFWDEMNILTQTRLPSEVSAPRSIICSPRGIFSRITHWRTAVLATAVIGFVFAVNLSGVFNLFAPAPVIYTTSVGEQKIITLADGSTVQLNTDTRLEVFYTDKRRRLSLMYGEAHFEVAYNSQRPFEVSAGKGLVRAIGTAFTVRIRKVDIEVIVTEGIVEMDKAETPDRTIPNNSGEPGSSPPLVGNSEAPVAELAVPFSVGIKITAGHKFVYDREVLDMVKLTVADKIEEELSWRQGMLVFRNEPLKNVVEEVSRYTLLKIVIPEHKARELLVGGLFSVGDTDSLFEALREGFDIHAERAPDGVVYLISGDKSDH